MKTTLLLGALFLTSMPALAQEGPIEIPLPYSVSTDSPEIPVREGAWRLSLAAPSPAFGQTRGVGRSKATTAQIPLKLTGLLLKNSPVGRVTLDSDNLVSSDAFDTAARLGVRIGVQKKLGPLSLVGGLGLIGNQKATTKNLSVDLGTRLPLGLKISGAEPSIDVNFLRFENRGVSAAVSPRHIGKSVFAPALGLQLPPVFLGSRPDIEKTPHLLLGATAWYFSNERAAPGFTPARLESLVSLGFLVPRTALPLKVPGVQGFSLAYQTGGNPAANYARIHNLRFGFLFTPPGLPAIPTASQRPEK